jgi:hypothetical protein
MKRIALAVCVAFFGAMMLSAPAMADTSTKNCDTFQHANQTQNVQVCVALNHNHNGHVNNVHIDFDDHLAGDVYYLRNIDISLYWVGPDGRTLVAERCCGDDPIFTTETDEWLDGPCMARTRTLIGVANFTIEWSPGVFSDVKAVASEPEVNGAVVCL